MHPTHLARRLAAVACLAFVALVVGACNHDSPFGVIGSIRSRNETAVAKAKTVKNHYLAFTSKKNDGGDQLFTFEDVYAPLRLEVTAGLFDPKHANLGGGTYEIQISPFKVLCTPTADGTTVALANSTTTIASLDFPQAAILDLAVEYGGTLLTVFARKQGDAQYSTVGSTTAVGFSPVEPRMEIDGIKKGGVVGIDNIRIAQRGHRPGQLTPGQQAVDDLYAAIDHLDAALYATDGAAANAAIAKQEVAAALPLMNSAATLLDGLAASDGRTTAKKKLTSALKSANSANKSLNAGKKAASVLHAVGEALCETSQAARSARFL